MSDRPILFSGPMVQAILREISAPGTGKTQTRRVLKPQPRIRPEIVEPTERGQPYWAVFDGDQEAHTVSVPFQTGDRLWVREHWRTLGRLDHLSPAEIQLPYPDLHFVADGAAPEWAPSSTGGRHRQAMHMPRWASRITLEVTDVRVQRLQEISEADALAEGVPECLEGGLGDEAYCNRCRGEGVHGALGQGGGVFEVDCSDCDTAIKKFRTLWDSLNADRAPWASNPWVVAVTFRPHLTNIDQMEKAG